VDVKGKPQQEEAERLAASRKLALESARLAASTRCHNVMVLDMAGVSPVTDFFVIATGTSARQMRSVCDELDELAEKSGHSSYHRSGYEGETWIAVDYIDVVVHIFSQDARAYYDLENLWGDAKRIAWQEPANTKS
jgi:ribosome-associated protein